LFRWSYQKTTIKPYGADLLSAISVSAPSGADVEIDLDASNVSASASSGESIEIEGHAGSLSADASSGGNIEAHNFESRKVKHPTLSGGGIKVWVTEGLAASVSSGSSVRYKGDPKHTDIDSGRYSGGNVWRL